VFVALVHTLRMSSQATTLEFGWDGTTALGGAVVDSQPARMLEDIRASGEQVSEQADLFLQNAEMDPKGFKFSEFMEMVEECYETQDLLWTNGGMVNEPGVNAGAAAVFSVAAIKGLEKEPTLEVRKAIKRSRSERSLLPAANSAFRAVNRRE